MAGPLVSVVIPCCNQGGFVQQALASVLEQTWGSWQVVIVDDGSTDDTAEILAAINHPRVQVLTQANRGVAAARNRGIEASQADYVVPLDADDCILPTMIEVCTTALLANPKLGYAYTHMELFGEVNEVYKHAPYNFYRLLHENDISVCAVVRKAAWADAGGYSDAVLPGIADWDFWLRCGSRGWHGKLLPEVLFQYRVRSGSMWEETKKDMAAVRRQLRNAHADLYSDEGMARVRREWHHRLDPHDPESILARAAKALPGPLRNALSRAYRRWILR
ncbi:MAG: glycosyltransferase family 2 protein [Planctomycetota bacterium]